MGLMDTYNYIISWAAVGPRYILDLIYIKYIMREDLNHTEAHKITIAPMMPEKSLDHHRSRPVRCCSSSNFRSNSKQITALMRKVRRNRNKKEHKLDPFSISCFQAKTFKQTTHGGAKKMHTRILISSFNLNKQHSLPSEYNRKNIFSSS